MPRGPLPKPEGEKVRRNEPTIPTTRLPVSGRKGPTPKLPKGKGLGKVGKAWWDWAWSTPQASAWDDGALQFVFRRADLEDDLALIDTLDGNQLDLAELLGMKSDDEALQHLRWVIRHLHALAAGKLQIVREMRDLDDRLGLNPKALAQLRWTIVADAPEERDGEGPVDDVARRRAEREKRLAAGG